MVFTPKFFDENFELDGGLIFGEDDFLKTGKPVEEVIEYDGKTYYFKSIAFMKPSMAGNFCSALNYSLTKDSKYH